MTEQVFTARRAPVLVPGSPEWLRVITASKMPSILKLNPKGWESKYSLWHKMNGTIPPSVNEPDEDTVEAGIYFERSVAEWWLAKHPEYRMQTGGFWLRKDNERIGCSPDRMNQNRVTKEWLPLECKTARYDEEWGTEMSNDIPVHYLVQVLHQMYVLGVDEVAVAVATPFFELREYRVKREDFIEDIELIERHALEFLRSLDEGEEPDLQFDNSTYQALRHLNPELEDRAEECPPELALELADAVRAEDAAEEAMNQVKVRIATRMGNAKRLVVPDPGGDPKKGMKVGHRQNGHKTTAPYFVANKRVIRNYTLEVKA